MSKTLSAAAIAISEALQTKVKLNEQHRGEGDSEVYLEHGEKAGYTKETLEGVKNYDRTYMAGQMDATAKLGLAALAADPKLERVEIVTSGVKGEEFSSVWTPKREGVIPGKDGAADKPWVSYGGLSGRHRSTTSGKSGDLGAAMDLSAAATEAVLAAK